MFVDIQGGGNWDESFAGGGFAESAAQVVKSIDERDWLATGANIAVSSLDMLGFFDNPVKSLGTSAIGWILEHISFLDRFLDHTTGDPGAVQNAADTFLAAAQKLDHVAAGQISAFKNQVPTYRSGHTDQSVAFENRVGPRGDELQALSLQSLGMAKAMSGAAALVATFRGLARDMLAEFAWWMLQKGAAAMAAATYTGGSSIVAWAADAGTYAANVAQKLTRKVTEIVESLSGLAGLLRRLAAVFDSSAVRTAATVVLQNAVPSAAKYIDDQTDPHEADQAAAAPDPTASAPASPGFTRPEPPPSTLPPLRESRPQQGPGLARWSTSGTLDE